MSGRKFHFIITVTWRDGVETKTAQSDGIITASPGQNREDLYLAVRQYCREYNSVPEDCVVKFFSLEPNDLEEAA